MKSDHRRRDWEDNHILITQAYFDLVKEKKRRPTLKEISEKSNISIQHVNSHLKQLTELKFEERFKDLRLMSGALVLSMFKHGAAGRAACAKLFFQIVEQFSEKFDHKLSGDALGAMTTQELEARLKELQIANRVKSEAENDRKKKTPSPKKDKAGK